MSTKGNTPGSIVKLKFCQNFTDLHSSPKERQRHLIVAFLLGKSVDSLLGPLKGVFPTPDTGPFFPSDADIQPKINVARHRHSELVVRHLTLHFSSTLTVIPKLTPDIAQNFEPTPDTQTPLHGPYCCGQLWVWHMFCGQDL